MLGGSRNGKVSEFRGTRLEEERESKGAMGLRTYGPVVFQAR